MWKYIREREKCVIFICTLYKIEHYSFVREKNKKSESILHFYSIYLNRIEHTNFSKKNITYQIS